MAVIYHTGKTEIEELLQCLCREKDRLNSNEAQIPIDYACGCQDHSLHGEFCVHPE